MVVSPEGGEAVGATRATDLQELVDSLADRLGRAVAVDDRQFRLVAYSAHPGTVDAVRTASILSRQAPHEAQTWALSQGIREAQGPLRLPANAALEMDSRVVAPARHDGALVGYLVLVDPEEALDEAALDAVAAAAETAAGLLYRDQLLNELDRGRERELLRDLLSTDDAVRVEAARALEEASLFRSGIPVAVLVARFADAEGSPLNEAGRNAVAAALDRLRPNLSPHQRLHLLRPDHCLLVFTPDDPSLPRGGAEALAELLHQHLLATIPDRWRVSVGIGDTQPSLDDAATSYQRALQAARVAEIVGSFGPVASWNSLGIYRLLARFPVDQVVSHALPPALVKLFADESARTLLETLECYLDLGCDAQRASALLSLHRASLYYRLHKVEDLAGVDLKDGEDRLALHLGLKLARLAGVHPLGHRPPLRHRS